MKNYRVTFFRVEKELNNKGKQVGSGKPELLGSIVVDDTLTGNLTITAKAFRRAPEACLMADKVTVEQL